MEHWFKSLSCQILSFFLPFIVFPILKDIHAIEKKKLFHKNRNTQIRIYAKHLELETGKTFETHSITNQNGNHQN